MGHVYNAVPHFEQALIKQATALRAQLSGPGIGVATLDSVKDAVAALFCCRGGHLWYMPYALHPKSLAFTQELPSASAVSVVSPTEANASPILSALA